MRVSLYLSRVRGVNPGRLSSPRESQGVEAMSIALRRFYLARGAHRCVEVRRAASIL